MKSEVIQCDLCRGAGWRGKRAVAQYWDTSGKRWDVCRGCLKLVIEAGLKYEMFAREGAQDAI